MTDSGRGGEEGLVKGRICLFDGAGMSGGTFLRRLKRLLLCRKLPLKRFLCGLRMSVSNSPLLCSSLEPYLRIPDLIFSSADPFSAPIHGTSPHSQFRAPDHFVIATVAVPGEFLADHMLRGLRERRGESPSRKEAALDIEFAS